VILRQSTFGTQAQIFPKAMTPSDLAIPQQAMVESAKETAFGQLGPIEKSGRLALRIPSRPQKRVVQRYIT
jgi:hypothetical protein